jgi:hypothetical protein
MPCALPSSACCTTHSTLTQDAEECGPIGCGDLTLTAQLDTYVVNVALLEGDPASALSAYNAFFDNPATLNGCPKPAGVKRQGNNMKGNFPGMPSFGDETNSLLDSMLKNKTDPRQAGEGTIPVAQNLFVMNGPVTVSSKTHETKWEEGWVDFMVPFATDKYDEQTLQDWIQQYGELPKVSTEDFGKFKFQLFRKDDKYH